MSAPDIQAVELGIVVRHREDGHLRFALPAVLCTETAAAALEAGLRPVAGVYRATVFRSQGKLSVYYEPHACSAREVALALRALLPEALRARPQEAHALTMAEEVRHSKAGHWVEAQAGRLRDKAREWRIKAGVLAGLARAKARTDPVLKSALTEKAVINFLNDITAFYLIKVHWDLITGRWLKEPLKYRYAWLTVFYLLFLLVRYRKQVMKKP